MDVQKTMGFIRKQQVRAAVRLAKTDIDENLKQTRQIIRQLKQAQKRSNQKFERLLAALLKQRGNGHRN